MKKLLIGLGAFIIIAFGGYRLADHLIMGGESYYVQITTDGEKQVDHADGGQEIISYRYELPGFNKEGKEKTMDFKGFQDRPLRKDAFLKVCGGRVLRLFHSQELMAVVVGNQDYDWIEWENNAEYKNGYSKDDETIKMFWEVFHEFDIDHKKKFLLFLTGSDRVPIMGMKAIKVSNIIGTLLYHN